VRRLHQILEPFMLRRQVQDVEGTLPEKVTITIKCPMTAYQGAIYSWVNATALLRIDPECDAALRTGANVKNLTNKVIELRKVCPALHGPRNVSRFRRKPEQASQQ
jgi:SNF2 family DNA or RNA helicase